MTPASSNFRTRLAAAGAVNPTRRPSSLYDRRASRCSSRRIFQSVLSSGLSVCKAILHYSFLFLEKYSIFLCVSHSLLARFQVSSNTSSVNCQDTCPRRTQYGSKGQRTLYGKKSKCESIQVGGEAVN